MDSKSLLYYHEAKDGQILEEGITEAGSMASFIAAGTSYATHGVPMIPFYIYYSMFGPQRVGDLFWLAGDIRAKGFLLGATAGRTTLNGEGLQHQDGHSLLHASTIPTLLPYDPAFAYELAVIIADGLRRMYRRGRGHFLLPLALQRKLCHAADARGRRGRHLKGLYKFKPGPDGKKLKAHIFGSGPIINSALQGAGNSGRTLRRLRRCLERDQLQAAAHRRACAASAGTCCIRPQPPKKSYVETLLAKEQGAFVAVSDNIRTVPDQIAPWVPGGLMTLGTDGFGRSDTRARLRRFFEVDAESTVIATLYALAEKGQVERQRRRARPSRIWAWTRKRSSRRLFER